MMFNAGSEATEFRLPPPPQGRKWVLAADTQRSSPDDIREVGDEAILDDQKKYEVGPRSSVILVGRPAKEGK
jgi:glycogen operon protein